MSELWAFAAPKLTERRIKNSSCGAVFYCLDSGRAISNRARFYSID